jgi:hypothetical protein
MVPADMFPHTINRRLFRLHNPVTPETGLKRLWMCFREQSTHIKIQGFPASLQPKSTFSAGGKSPESPVFNPFFRRLLVFYILSSRRRTQRGSSRLD